MAKITRQTQKIFANAATNNGVIGSGQDGSKVLSNSLATLQGLGAWDTGWLDMVLGAKKFPPLEEFQALDYINTYQLSYLFQEGVPEYDSGTTYFTNSWVKKAGTNKLYASIADTNAGNALTDATKWKLLIDFDATTAADLVLNFAADTGTQNHFLTAPSPAIVSYVTGTVIWIKPAHTITGACDVGVNGLVLKSIKLPSGANPAQDNMTTSGVYCLVYDGTNFVLTNPSYVFGTAAFLNADNSPNNLPVLDSLGRLPAVSGALLTGLLSGSPGLIVLDKLGITIQYGSGVCSSHFGATSALGLNIFPTPFSAAPTFVTFMVKNPASTPGFTTGQQLTPNVSNITASGFYAQAPTWGSSVGSQPMFYIAIGAT